jgi:hypothetical protein
MLRKWSNAKYNPNEDIEELLGGSRDERGR